MRLMRQGRRPIILWYSDSLRMQTLQGIKTWRFLFLSLSDLNILPLCTCSYT